MDQVQQKCVTLLVVSLAVYFTVAEGGYTRPVNQQYPWNTYTTRRPQPTEDGSQFTLTSSSTPTSTSLPEITTLSPTNTLDPADYIMVIDKDTNIPFLMTRENFWNRFIARTPSSKTRTRTRRQVNISQDRDALARNSLGDYFLPSSNEISEFDSPSPIRTANSRYGSPTLQRGVYPYFHGSTHGVNVLPTIFQNYNPYRAIYSYSALGRLCSYGECNYSIYNKNNRNAAQESNSSAAAGSLQRSYFPPATIRPRKPKLTSTWIPMIYRTSSSTEGKVEEVVTTTTSEDVDITVAKEQPAPTESYDKPLKEKTTIIFPDSTTTTTPPSMTSSPVENEPTAITEVIPMVPVSLESLESDYEGESVKL